MSNFKYRAGLNNVGSYQVSGAPFLTSSMSPASGSDPTANSLKISFPYVTKEITVTNFGAANLGLTGSLRVAMSSRGLSDNVGFGKFIKIPVSASATLDVKATEVYLMSNDNVELEFSLYASLTNIPAERVNNIAPSGSNWSGSAGVK
jgi:hypothetical protein